MKYSIHRKWCFRRAACVLATLLTGAASLAADIAYETRALTGTDGPLGPGLGPGVTFSDFSTSPVLNGAGQTAFRGVVTGTGVTASNFSGIWSEGGGSGLALVARGDDPAPGTASGVKFSPYGSSFENPALNDAGQTAFRGVLTGTGVSFSNDGGIWSEGGGSGLALVAREGGPAPGTAAGVNFFDFENPALNDAGQTAFRGNITGTGVTSANDFGIWSEGGGSGLALVAREGDPAPGTAVGVEFRTLESLAFNNVGQTAFMGRLTGAGVTTANDFGIWSEGGGSGLALIAREGDPAPGTPAGVNFGNAFSAAALNDSGQTAFRGVLTGAGVTGANDFGIWSEGGGAGLALIAREGDGAPGTPADVNFGNFLNSPVLNGAGHTAFFGTLNGPGVDNTNREGLWSEGGGSGLALVAREGNQAPGTAAGVNFNGFISDEPLLNGVGQIAFEGLLTGAGVTSSNDRGLWATDLAGLLQLIVREGDLFDVSNDPINPDLRTIFDFSLTTNSGGEDGRPSGFNDAGQLAFFASFTDGSEGIFVATIGGPSVSASPFNVTITKATAPATGYDFTWNSQSGKVYDLVTSTHLATPIDEWPVHASYSDIPATGMTTTLTSVPVDGPRRFFAVVERDAVPAE